MGVRSGARATGEPGCPGFRGRNLKGVRGHVSRPLDPHLRSWSILHGVDTLMPIGEFSERSGLSPRRLRSYAAAGLLVPAAVDSSSGYRYYSPGQLRSAQVIDALRNAGICLADIAVLLRDPSPARLDRWAVQLEADAAKRQEALRLTRDLLRANSGPVHADADHTGPDHPRRETTMNLRSSARTDTGQVRETNQDAMVCLDRLVAVADGMGGSPRGDRASSLAVAIVAAAFTGQSLDELGAALRAANTAIFERAAEGEGLEGMGTTLCAAGLTHDGRLVVANVGDSRAYLVRGGALQQLTEDHSVTAAMVRRGELTEEDAPHHPHHSVLTRAVGVGPTVDVDTFVQPVDPGDRVLLCTDGLFNEVPAEQTLVVMGTAEDPSDVVDALVERALSNGGHDNVTVIVSEVCR